MPILMVRTMNTAERYLAVIMATILFSVLTFYPIPGNHDYISVNGTDDPSIPWQFYYDIVEVFKNAEMGGVPSTMEAYYSYDYGNTHFLALNSELYRVFIFWDAFGTTFKIG